MVAATPPLLSTGTPIMRRAPNGNGGDEETENSGDQENERRNVERHIGEARTSRAGRDLEARIGVSGRDGRRDEVRKNNQAANNGHESRLEEIPAM